MRPRTFAIYRAVANGHVLPYQLLESLVADDLRHTFASLALQESVPVKVVSEMLRHASVTITYDICSRDPGHVT